MSGVLVLYLLFLNILSECEFYTDQVQQHTHYSFYCSVPLHREKENNKKNIYDIIDYIYEYLNII